MSSVLSLVAGGWAHRVMYRIGAYTRLVASLLAQTIGLCLGVIAAALRPRTWRRTVRAEFVTQLHIIGVRAVASTLVVGSVLGLGLVFQALYWLESVGQGDLVGTILVRGLVRDTAPFLVALIMIGRSGSLMVSELVSLREEGQLHMLEGLGIDPFEMLIVPRVLALALATFCLTVCFITAALFAGFVASSFAGVTERSFLGFSNDVLAGMSASEYALVALKCPSLGFMVGIVSTITALSPQEAHAGTDQLLPRGFMRSLLAVLLISVAWDVVL